MTTGYGTPGMDLGGGRALREPALIASLPEPASGLGPTGDDPARDPVFVFGSNLAGRHGKGAALWARRHRGAIYGRGCGIQGNSYAIPTKGHRLETLPLGVIQAFVSEFIQFAHKYWMRQFQLTPIGCGLAGYKREQIEPLFHGAPSNVIWPPEWAPCDSDRSAEGGQTAKQAGPKARARAEGIAQADQVEQP